MPPVAYAAESAVAVSTPVVNPNAASGVPTKKEGVGTGLGLSVSYNIIKKNGGRLEVKSRPGEGTCFSIFLPLAETASVEV